MYIKKRMGDTGDPCGITFFTLCLGLMNPSITSSTYRFLYIFIVWDDIAIWLRI